MACGLSCESSIRRTSERTVFGSVRSCCQRASRRKSKAGQRKFVASNVNRANMAYADQLPEDASDMVKPVPQTCICQRRDVPAPWDVIEAREMRRYPRTILEITYNR